MDRACIIQRFHGEPVQLPVLQVDMPTTAIYIRAPVESLLVIHAIPRIPWLVAADMNSCVANGPNPNSPVQM